MTQVSVSTKHVVTATVEVDMPDIGTPNLTFERFLADRLEEAAKKAVFEYTTPQARTVEYGKNANAEW